LRQLIVAIIRGSKNAAVCAVIVAVLRALDCHMRSLLRPMRAGRAVIPPSSKNAILGFGTRSVQVTLTIDAEDDRHDQAYADFRDAL
jgi:hypothetical protein